MSENERPFNPWMVINSTDNDKGGKHFNVFLREMITEPHCYFDLLNILTMSTEDDTIDIYIDNNGGYLMTGIIISEAIKETKAFVRTIAIRIAASAAALIFTNGHEKLADDWSFVMFHTASYLNMGTTRYHEDKVIYTNDLMKQIMSEARANLLLTDEEINDIFTKAKDIFIPGTLINERKVRRENV